MGRGATQRREAARQEMREEILRVAREMVAAEGVANLSLRAIARTLGYSPAALYEYFPSKEAIAKALYFGGTEGLAGKMRREIDQLGDTVPPLELKKALGRAYREYALANAELFLLVFGSGDAFGTISEQLEKNSEGYDTLLEVVQRGLDSGDLVPMPVEVLAASVWAGVHGFVMLELSGAFGSHDPTCEVGNTMQDSSDDLFEAHLELIDSGVRRRD